MTHPRPRSAHHDAPDVSIVTATRNRLSFLQEALESVRVQTRDGWELIVVDDASEDGTFAWLDGLADPRIVALRLERHSEKSTARNRGLERVRGTFVMFLDDDDRLRPDALAILTEALAARSRAVAAVGARWRFGAGIPGARMVHPKRALERVVWPDLLAGWSAPSGQGLYRTSAVRTAGGFLDFFPVEDREWWLRLAALGPVILRPEIVFEYRIHAGQVRASSAERRVIYDAFIDRLPAAQRRGAARIRDGGQWWRWADEARERGEYAESLRCYARAVATSPALARSPLVWPALAHGSLDAWQRLLGSGARRLLARLSL